MSEQQPAARLSLHLETMQPILDVFSWCHIQTNMSSSWKRGRNDGGIRRMDEETRRDRRAEHHVESPRGARQEGTKRSRTYSPQPQFSSGRRPPGNSGRSSQEGQYRPGGRSQEGHYGPAGSNDRGDHRSGNGGMRPFSMAKDQETDPHKIQQRQKQIRFGKNTIGYDNYTKAVPKKDRQFGNVMHPYTPDPYRRRSKREFDSIMHKWRRGLHQWDSKVFASILKSYILVIFHLHHLRYRRQSLHCSFSYLLFYIFL